MINTDYQFYTDIFKGTIIPDVYAFESAVIEASAYIEYITMGNVSKLKTIPDKVHMAVCAVAEVIYNESQQGSISSESVGNHSVSYNTNRDFENNKAYKARLYLAGTGLLYRGLH